MSISSVLGRRSNPGIGLALLGLLVAGCEKSPLLAPTNSTVSVSASTRVLALGSTTEISAYVLESSGTPVHNGTTVRFTTSLGSVNPVEAQTRDGLATTTFSAGTVSGVAEVRASSGGAGGGTASGTTGTTTATNVIQITLGAAAANAVVVSATSPNVPSSGGTVGIVASTLDTNGNKLANVPVTFSTTAGSLSATTQSTDANGNARVDLTTNRTATVKATVGAKEATVTVNVAASNSVSLLVSPNPGSAGQPVTLAVTPVIGANNLPPTVSVNWGDGSTSELGKVPAAISATHVYTTVGSYSITATATSEGETFTTSAAVTITQKSVAVSASPTTGTISQIFTFTVTPAVGSNPASVVIDFGDTTSENLGPITGQATVTKIYGTTGTKTVRVTQTDVNGLSSVATTVVTVTAP